jgi:hypothetical protein
MSLKSINDSLRIMRIVLTLGCFLAITSPVTADDMAALDHYLLRLKLVDLRLQLHEQALTTATTPPARQRAATQLAELYAQRLLEIADSPERYAALVQRVEKLTSRYPEVASHALRVMLMQAEYQRAEALAVQWIDDPTRISARQEALAIYKKMLPELTQIRIALEQVVEEKLKLYDAVEESSSPRPAGFSVVALEKDVQQTQEILNRATFFEGWGALFQVLLAENVATEKTTLSTALTSFGKLLELSPEADSYEFEEDSLDLNSVWRARTLLGFATALAAAEKHNIASECFEALQRANDPTVREGAAYWQVLALIRTRQWGKATQVAQEQLANALPETAAPLLPVAVLLVRNGWGTKEASPVELELVQLGLHAIARMKKYEALGALVAKYRNEPTRDDGFYPLWMKGRLLFAAAEKEPSAKRYKAAAKFFEQALDLPTATDDPTAAALCEYGWAWCEYRQQHYLEAVRAFEETATILKTLRDETAVQASWMVFTCHQALHSISQAERHATAAQQALENIVRDFPQSEQARRAEYLLTKIKTARGPSEAYLQSLEKVPADSPNYLSARFDLAVARHRLWSEAKENDPQKKFLAEKTVRDLQQYLRAAPLSEGSRRVKATLLNVDLLLKDRDVRWSEMEQLLEREAALAEKLKPEDPVAAEYHYRSLQVAQMSKKEEAMRSHAAWLSAHAANSPYEIPALVVLAKGMEERYAQAAEKTKPALRDELIRLYQKLSQSWGDSTTVLQDKKNAAVALAKLAQWEAEAGHFSSSAEKWEKLIAAFPTDAHYLRQAGSTWFQARSFDKALPHWQLLVAGGDNQSAGWYEAKYYQVQCLLATDTEGARKAWKQFQLLHPEVTEPSWRVRFAELAEQFRGVAP